MVSIISLISRCIFSFENLVESGYSLQIGKKEHLKRKEKIMIGKNKESDKTTETVGNNQAFLCWKKGNFVFKKFALDQSSLKNTFREFCKEKK